MLEKESTQSKIKLSKIIAAFPHTTKPGKENTEISDITEKLLLQLESRDTVWLEELAQEPFYREKILVYIYREKSLPDNQTKLIQYLVEETFQREEQNGGLTKKEATKLQKGLGRLAFNLTEAIQLEPIKQVQAELWFSHIPFNFKKQAKLKASEATLDKAENFLRIANKAGLLIRENYKLRFYHRLFQDYFCARFCMSHRFTSRFLTRVATPPFDTVWTIWAELDSTLESRLHNIAKPSLKNKIKGWVEACHRFSSSRIAFWIIVPPVLFSWILALVTLQGFIPLLEIIPCLLVMLTALPYFHSPKFATFALGNLKKNRGIYTPEDYKDIKDFYTFNHRGIAYQSLKQYEAAIQNYVKAAELNPKFSHAFYNLGLVYNALQKYELAIQNHTKAIELKPKYVSAYYNRGRAYYALKQYDKAIQDYTKVLKLKPKLDYAFISRGNAYISLKQHDKAIQDYTNAIKINPKDAIAFNNRGVAYHALKQYERAIQEHSKVIELKPKDSNAFIRRGNGYFFLKEFERAREDYIKAREIDSQKCQVFSNLGSVLVHFKQYDKAKQEYDAAIELNPKCSCAFFNRGIISLLERNLESAKLEFIHSWELDKTRVRFGWMISWCNLIQVRSDPEIEAQLEQIATYGPDQATAYTCRGVLKLLRKEYEQALVEFEECIRQESTQWDGFFWKGMALAYLGKSEEALAAINKSLELELPPVLLTTLRWFEVDLPDFYREFVIPLLEKHLPDLPDSPAAKPRREGI